MPAPRGRGKGKSKSKSSRPKGAGGSFDALVNDIDNARLGVEAVNIICQFFELPDLTKRSGLKKVHANFTDIYTRLDALYSRYPENEKVVSGIIGVYSKMCSDSILRDRLFRQGILAKLVPMLDMPLGGVSALRSLSNITHHGGIESRQEIAKITPRLVRLVESLPDDEKVSELVVVTLAHSIGSVTAIDRAPDAKLLAAVDVPSVYRVLPTILRQPWASEYLLTHVEELIASTAYYCDKELRKHPSVVRFPVSLLRSQDIGSRSASLASMLRLSGRDSEVDRAGTDPGRLVSAAERPMPAEGKALLQAYKYGLNATDTFRTMLSTRDFTKAMMRVAQTHDLYALGKTIAELILRTEFALVNGEWQTEDPRTGALQGMDIGLPFTRWLDGLPHCASAIRQRGAPAETVLADIIDCKYKVATNRVADAVALAKRAIERTPDVGYFCYVVSLCADHNDGLRYAKRGLKCRTHMTPFVRASLLHRAIEHAGDLAVMALMEARPGEQKWKDGIGFLRSAFEDCKAYMVEAPPDARQMKNVMNWFVLLSCVVRGPEIGPDMAELKDLLVKLKAVENLAIHIGHPIVNTQIRLARTTIVAHYTEAWKEWGAVVTRYDTLQDPAKQRPVPKDDGTADEAKAAKDADDDLARWLDEIDLEDGETRLETCSHPNISANWSTELYRCANCGNKSAVLRKCSQCSKARYCDAGCQRSHWPQHKAKCQVEDSAADERSLVKPSKS